MDLFNVIFSPKARGQLDDYIGYIQYVFMSEEAAKRVYDDAMETLETLSKVAASLQYGIAKLEINQILAFFY